MHKRQIAAYPVSPRLGSSPIKPETMPVWEASLGSIGQVNLKRTADRCGWSSAGLIARWVYDGQFIDFPQTEPTRISGLPDVIRAERFKIPFTPSPGKPKIESTPHSMRRSTNKSAVILAIIAFLSYFVRTNARTPSVAAPANAVMPLCSASHVVAAFS